MLVGAPRLGAVLPTFLEFARDCVLVAHNAPYDVGFLKGACARHGQAWPGPAVVDTARLARAVLSRDEVPNCKLGTLGPVLPGGDRAGAPGAGRRPGHRRRPPRAARAGGRRGRADPGGADHLLRPGVRRTAAQAPPRRGPAGAPRCLRLRGCRRPGAVRRHVAQPAGPGPAVLHRRRAAGPDGGDGRPGRTGRADRVRDHPRGPGARAAAHRRARPALQPALPLPRPAVLAEAHRRAVPPAVRRPRGPARRRRRRRVPRAVRRPAGRRAGRRGPARGGTAAHLPRPAVHGVAAARRASPSSWAAAGRPATGPSRWRGTPRWSPTPAGR